MLEECRISYRATFIDILAGDQLAPSFLALNPSNKHPVIVDPEGPGGQPITVWESGAILIYLAEKHRCFMPDDPVRRIETLKWLFFQVANQGPYAGQYAHFAFYAKEEHRYPYAIDRYRNEVLRQLRIMDAHLEAHEFFADEYTIADIALLPYAASMALAPWDELPHLAAGVAPCSPARRRTRDEVHGRARAEGNDRWRNEGLQRRASLGALRRTPVPNTGVR